MGDRPRLDRLDQRFILNPRDERLEDIDNLPPPAVPASEVAEDLQSALAEIQALTEALTGTADSGP